MSRRSTSAAPVPDRIALAVDAAFALSVRYFAPPWRVGDAALFANGRLRVWAGWQALGEVDRAKVARFLRLRPEGLADERQFLEAAHRSLNLETRFRSEPSEPPDDPRDRQFVAVAGKPIDQLLDGLLDELDAAGVARTPPSMPQVELDDAASNLRDHRIGYAVPLEVLSARVSDQRGWPALRQTGRVASIGLERDGLLEVAGTLDGAGVSHSRHRAVLETLWSQLEVPGLGVPLGPSAAAHAGRTRLLVAPTGRGKSVLAHVAALYLAKQGVSVALIVPDVKEVMREAYRLERHIAALGWPLKVAAVNSAAGQMHKATDILTHAAEDDGQASWAVNRLAYPCLLSAYADGRPADAGQEPCFRLRQQVRGVERAVSCPFATTCPKFDSFRTAADADILVVNHSAFLMGRVPIPVTVNGRLIHKMPVMELVFRRCGAVMIDEIDRLQSNAIEQDAGHLQLSSRTRVSPVYQLLTEFQHAKANGELPDEVRVDRLRRQLHLVCWLADELADMINNDEVEWGRHDTMRWSRAADGWLADKLFDGAADPTERLDEVFGDAVITENPAAEALRLATLDWSRRALEDEDETVDHRAALNDALSRWPGSFGRNGDRTQAIVAKVADAIVLRAVLDRLERALGDLRPQLATLEHYGLEAATTVRDALLGYAPWTPSPLGPLGRRIVGFTFQRNAGGPGALHAQALCGDPHGLIAGLGDESALAHCGHQRVVLGLSATARFPGSPTSDVLGDVLLTQPDAARDIEIFPSIVDAGDGNPLRISGESSPDRRMDRVQELARHAWRKVLRDHLASLAAAPSTRDRARILVVTGSYTETRRAAEAIAQEIGSTREADERVRFVAPERDLGSNGLRGFGGRLNRAIPPREIESFGQGNADVLVAPLSVVARGHNIVIPGLNGSGRSAIGSIFVLVRPVPPANSASGVLAHISYGANRAPATGASVAECVAAERRVALARLHDMRRKAGPFGQMDRELRHAVLCDVLVDLAQLAGRCRRGQTDVRVYLVDGAFHDAHVGWDRLVSEVFETWKSRSELAQMMEMHGSFLSALARFANLEA